MPLLALTAKRPPRARVEPIRSSDLPAGAKATLATSPAIGSASAPPDGRAASRSARNHRLPALLHFTGAPSQGAAGDGMKARVWMISVALLCSGAFDCAAQSAAPYRGALTVTVENDAFTGSDNNYTNGIGVSWVSNAIDTYEEKSFVRRWGDFWSFLPLVADEGSRRYVAWSLAQEMHTPDDIKNPNPPRDDQPYAGVLYLDSVIYARKERWTHAWRLRVGVVGPASQADSVQDWFHQRIGVDKPMGWATQLPNEPVLNVGYTGTYLLAKGTWANRPRGESFPWPTQVSATTSPVSDSVCRARSGGTSWMPWAEQPCGKG